MLQLFFYLYNTKMISISRNAAALLLPTKMILSNVLMPPSSSSAAPGSCSRQRCTNVPGSSGHPHSFGVSVLDHVPGVCVCILRTPMCHF